MNLSTCKRRVKSVNGMARRIVEFHRTHVNGAHKRDGACWYVDAFNFCRNLAMQFDLNLCTVTGVVSALSPAVSWSVNKQDARNLIHAYCMDGAPERCTVSTYGPNKAKAIGILDADDPDEPFTAREFFNKDTKTESFFYNLSSPYGLPFITVDRHAIGVALGSTGTGHQAMSVTPKRYRDIAEAYRVAAKALGYYHPCDLQAVCWVAYRETYVDARYQFESEYSDAPF